MIGDVEHGHAAALSGGKVVHRGGNFLVIEEFETSLKPVSGNTNRRVYVKVRSSRANLHHCSVSRRAVALPVRSDSRQA
jgi:predicted P-loop ATPase/GTPase